MLRRSIVFGLLGTLAALGATASAQTLPAPLTAFAQAWNGIAGYTTDVQCYNVKGSENATSTYRYSFTKPSSISMDILSGPSAGNSVSWSGGSNVVAGSGMFKKSFSLTDPKVTSLRGATVVDLSFGSILKHTQETKGSLSAARTTLDGAGVSLVDLNVADPSSDNGLTREALYLSDATHLPLRVDGYEGTKLVTSCTFSKTVTK